jgi:molecular chaperone GrpE
MSENEVRPDSATPATGGETPVADAAALTAERDDYLARWQRAAADYQNLKRRSATEVEGAVRRSLEGLLAGLLLVVDHLELALAAEARSEDARALAEGVRLTRDQLLGTLRQEGVEPIAEGGTFDANLHQAVATLERADLEPGRIVDTLRRGYTWRGQVLRAAHVRVSRAPQDAPEAG